MQILNAKLYIPPPRPNLVARPKLIAQLDEGLRLGCKLSLVCAPAGFGKTTLVSAWVHDLRQRVPVAWLSIDEEDNDSQRFAVYVVAALRTLLSASDAENFGAHFLTEIHTPHHISGDVMAQVREQVAILLNDIAALPEKFVLVLDDYYLLNDPRIEQGMVFLLAHQPPQMHLVITSRTTPSLPLARLRARAQLTELNADNLRFTPDEANLFFDQTMGLALSSEHITQLEMRTEGWAAGLQMAALSMQGVADKASFIQTFAGDDHYILDYLLEEVLRRQPEAVQDFMLRTSVLERMCGPLCDAILGMGARELGSKGDISSPLPPVPVSQTTLEYLERANLFIVPLDNKHQWYRYHHLFGELLRHRLEQKMGEAAVMALHQAAAAWYLHHTWQAEAIAHLLRAQDFERAAGLIEQNAEGMLQRNETAMLRHWLDVIPQDTVRAHPFLCLSYAWALVAQAQFDAAAMWVEYAETALGLSSEVTNLGTGSQRDAVDKSMLGHIAALHITIDSNRGSDDRVIKLAQQALDNLSADDALLRSIIAESVGEAYLRRNDIPNARRAFAESIAIGEKEGNIIAMLAALSGLGVSYVCEGDVHQAVRIYRQAIALGTSRGVGGQPVPATGLLHMHLASCLYEWNELDDALHHAQQGIAGCERWGHTMNLLDAYCILTRIQHARGHHADAIATLSAAEQVMDEACNRSLPMGQQILGLDWARYRIQVLQAYFRLQTGNVDAAARSVAQLVRQRHISEDDALPYLLRPRLYLAQGNVDAALSLLASARRHNEINNAPISWLLDALALQACAFYMKGNLPRSIETLERALLLGEPGNYIRTFVDNGTPMDVLLRQYAARGVASDYVGCILAAFSSPTHPGEESSAVSLGEALSERETEVLHLIAADLSNQQIADALFISINTVKTHIRRLYGKLHVNSRLQAVERARDLNLL